MTLGALASFVWLIVKAAYKVAGDALIHQRMDERYAKLRDLNQLKDDVQGVKFDVQEVRTELASVKEDMAGRLDRIEDRTAEEFAKTHQSLGVILQHVLQVSLFMKPKLGD